MTSTPAVQIQATYADSQLSALVSVLEGNLDLDYVAVRREEYAIKAFIPVEFIIITASAYLLEKFVLAPAIDPLAEKFNWVNAVQKYLKPVQPFNLTITLTEDKLTIEAPLGTSHSITAEIWSIIKKTLDILRAENKLGKISKIRFAPRQTDELIILCYEGGKPKHIVNLEGRVTLEISDSRFIQPESAEISVEDWLEEQLEKSEKYRQFVAKFK
mgnify:FL=1